MLVILLLVWVFYANTGWHLHWYLSLGIGLICGTLPFVLNPVDIDTSASHSEQALHYPIDLHWLYENPNGKPPPIGLTKGKHILAFLSTTCPHCRLAAYKLHVMHGRNPLLPIFLVLNGKPENIADFYNETKANDIPAINLKGVYMLKMSGPQLPAIFFINNDTVIKKPNYMQLNQAEAEKWLAEKP